MAEYIKWHCTATKESFAYCVFDASKIEIISSYANHISIYEPLIKT